MHHHLYIPFDKNQVSSKHHPLINARPFAYSLWNMRQLISASPPIGTLRLNAELVRNCNIFE